METIPALLAEERVVDPGAAGLGIVELKGGERIEGYLELIPGWVLVALRRPDERGCARKGYPAARVLCVEFWEDE